MKVDSPSEFVMSEIGRLGASVVFEEPAWGDNLAFERRVSETCSTDYLATLSLVAGEMAPPDYGDVTARAA